MKDTLLHPWNESVWTSLIKPGQHLAHALLFCGSEGLGKLNLAMRLARQVLCSSPDAHNEACAECRNCSLFSAGTHPDFHLICSEQAAISKTRLSARYGARYLPEMKHTKDAKLKSIIGIDQIRTLIANSSTHPHIAASKVILISPAQAMNINAANALLKLLEEPPESTLIILVCPNAESLVPTIRSRCMRVAFITPDQENVVQWTKSQTGDISKVETALGLASGAPLKALEYLEDGFIEQRLQLLSDIEQLIHQVGDPLEIASAWKSWGTQISLNWLHGIISDLIHVCMSENPPRLFNPDLKDRLKSLLKKINLQELFEFNQNIGATRILEVGPLDETLLLEATLIDLQGRGTA